MYSIMQGVTTAAAFLTVGLNMSDVAQWRPLLALRWRLTHCGDCGGNRSARQINKRHLAHVLVVASGTEHSDTDSPSIVYLRPSSTVS